MVIEAIEDLQGLEVDKVCSKQDLSALLYQLCMDLMLMRNNFLILGPHVKQSGGQMTCPVIWWLFWNKTAINMKAVKEKEYACLKCL